jgi:putative transposase
MLPSSFPPWPTVFAHFRRWRLDGTLRRMHDRLRALAREAEGRQAEPSAAILDRSGVAAAVASWAVHCHMPGCEADTRRA